MKEMKELNNDLKKKALDAINGAIQSVDKCKETITEALRNENIDPVNKEKLLNANAEANEVKKVLSTTRKSVIGGSTNPINAEIDANNIITTYQDKSKAIKDGSFYFEK